MKYYFNLQYKMLNRHLKAFGLPPIIGYLLAIFFFIGGSVYLFYKTKYAAYLYPFFALSSLSLLSETKRNDFLKTCFIDKDYRRIRLAENFLMALPFVLFLGYQQAWLIGFGLVIMAGLMARFHFNNQLNYTIPTPFYKYPFEFTVGFRTSIAMFLFAYFLTVMSIKVGNFNLGAFALLLVFIISFSFYALPDSQFYVWIFSSTAKAFLWDKIKIALFYSTLLALPILLSLGYSFPDKMKLLLGFQGLGYIYLCTIILAKYAAFPRAMNLPETIFIVASVFFPPFLLFTIPFFTKKATKKLSSVLSENLMSHQSPTQ